MIFRKKKEMALLGRIRHSRLESISYQCKRWYFHIPGGSSTRCAAEGNNIRILEKPVSVFQQRSTELYQTLRFFAVPVQFKPKPEEKDPNGPRLNNQIMAEFVRLVSDEGHAIVSRHEALERAKKLKLDLVEVQRTAKPPVCKIMDFHREKYKQQVKEKDRAKSKSEVTLRKGDSKEVRFSAKTEQKDLQMKADMVKRLMERGYRVKCMAVGTEDQDLGGLLSRLAALIEDVAVIESGPRVEKRQAFVLVRHIKFGPPKKGPIKKASTLLKATIPEVQNTASQSNPIPIPDQIKDRESTESGSEAEDEIFEPISINGGIGEKNKSTWSAFEASDDFEQVFDLADNVNRVTLNSAAKTSNLLENVGSTGQEPVSGSKRASTVVFTPPPDPSLELQERKSIESKQFSESSKFSLVKENDIDRAQDAAKVVKLGPTQLPNKAREPPILPNASPLKPPLMEESSPKQGLSHSGTPSIPTPGYGIFSAPKTVSPGKQYDKERNPFVTSKNSDSSKIPVNLKPPILRDESTQNSGSDKVNQGGWGIFSK